MHLTVTPEGMSLDFEAAATNRKCGSCSLCCKLLPATSLDKGANTRCKYQRQNPNGCCSIYDRRPWECQVWACRWLSSADTAGMPRPDRCHYVLDPMPDMIRITNNQTGEATDHSALQVWVDPAHRDAAHVPQLRQYMAHIADTMGWPTIVRFSSREGFVVFPPALSHDGEWHDRGSSSAEDFGTIARLKALGVEVVT